MPVKTKCIFEPIEEGDGRRILITRYYPRGVKKEHFDEWVYALSPSPKLLFSYKNGEKNWQEFMRSFIQEIRLNDYSMEAVHALNTVSKTEDITLLCFERDHTPCHRHLVRDIIENPDLLAVRLHSKDADDYPRVVMLGHIPDKEAGFIPFLANV